MEKTKWKEGIIFLIRLGYRKSDVDNYRAVEFPQPDRRIGTFSAASMKWDLSP